MGAAGAKPEGNHKGCPYMGRGPMNGATLGTGPTTSAFERPTEFRDL